MIICIILYNYLKVHADIFISIYTIEQYRQVLIDWVKCVKTLGTFTTILLEVWLCS